MLYILVQSGVGYLIAHYNALNCCLCRCCVADRKLTTYRVKKVFPPLAGPTLSKSQGGIWRNGIQSDKQSTDAAQLIRRVSSVCLSGWSELLFKNLIKPGLGLSR